MTYVIILIIQAVFVVLIETGMFVDICSNLVWDEWSFQYAGDNKDYLDDVYDYYTKNENSSDSSSNSGYIVNSNNNVSDQYVGEDEDYLESLNEYYIKKYENRNNFLTDSITAWKNLEAEFEMDDSFKNIANDTNNSIDLDNSQAKITKQVENLILAEEIDYDVENSILEELNSNIPEKETKDINNITF